MSLLLLLSSWLPCTLLSCASAELVLLISLCGRLVIKLKKKELGLEWSALDDTADRKAAERDKRIKNGDLKDANTQQLLADMYESE